MKNIKKAICSIFVATAMTVTSLPAFAAVEEATLLSAEALVVQNMTGQQFDDFVVHYVNDSQDAGKSLSEIQEELKLLGVDFFSNESTLSTRAIPPDTGVSMSSYAIKRGNEDFYRVYGTVEFNTKEWYPSVEDILTVEWDSSVATYSGYSDNEDDFTSYRDGSQRYNGIILFNVNDKPMWPGDVAYGVAHVTPNSQSGDLAIASSFVHTYDTTEFQWSGNLEVSIGIPLGGSASISVSASSEGRSIPFYADNNIYF